MRKDFKKREVGPRINARIRAREVKVIDKNGEMLGVLPLPRALTIAREDGLDLVEVQPNARPPVCKILDYGRYKYELKKKARDNKKKQTHMQEKQLRFHVNTSAHDVETQIRKARRFLEEGNRVTFTIRLRGREHEHKREARLHFDRCRRDLEDLGKVEVDVRQDGHTMMMTISPLGKQARERKKAELAQRKAQEEAQKAAEQ